MRVLVTGAAGFVGRPLCRRLAELGMAVVPVVRRPSGLAGEVVVPDIGADTEWLPVLKGIDRVVHLAAQAHIPAGQSLEPLRRLNRDGAVRLAECCAAAGVRRLVFMSSIKVNGEETPPDRPFTAEDSPAPVDAYGLVKAEAEQALAGVTERTGLELVVIRPPLVHGPGAKGNLRTLMTAIRRRLPLPLGCLTGNRRSLVGVDNLADAVAVCLTHQGAPGRTFLIADDGAVSTAGLAVTLAAGLGRRPLLLRVPPPILWLAAQLAGRPGAARRLTGSLVVDGSPIRRDLGWTPRYTLDDGLVAMAAAFVKERP